MACPDHSWDYTKGCAGCREFKRQRTKKYRPVLGPALDSGHCRGGVMKEEWDWTMTRTELLTARGMI